MTIISLSGKKQSGKNEVAKIIQSLTPLWCAEIAYADALKSEVAFACGQSVTEVNIYKEVFRPILQWWGTDFRRKFQEQDLYWIHRLDGKLAILTDADKHDIIIITDCRFKNELQYAQDIKAVTVNITRPNPLPKDLHISENELDFAKFDYTIENNGTIGELREKVKELMIKLNIRMKQ